MTGENPDIQGASDLKDVVVLKEKEIQGGLSDNSESIVDEDAVASAESALAKRLEDLKLGGVYQEKIEGKLKEVKDKWAKKISGIKSDSVEALKSTTNNLLQELRDFTEQKDVKTIIDVFDPFFRNKDLIISTISLEKYKKSSGHWNAINTRLYAIGITKTQISTLQKQVGIKADGKVGPQTITAMFKMYGNDKTVEFDDGETTLSAGAISKDFEEYSKGAERIRDVIDNNQEWKNLEAEWAGKYNNEMTLENIVMTRGDEEVAKRTLIARLMKSEGGATPPVDTAVLGVEAAVTEAAEATLEAGAEVSELNLVINPELIFGDQMSIPGSCKDNGVEDNGGNTLASEAEAVPASGDETATVGHAEVALEIVDPTPKEMEELMNEKFGEILKNQDKFAFNSFRFSVAKYNPTLKNVEMTYPLEGANQRMILSYNIATQKAEMKFEGNGTLLVKNEGKEAIDGKKYIVEQWKKINGSDMPEKVRLTYLNFKIFDEKVDMERGKAIKAEILAGTRDSVTSEELEVLKRTVLKKQTIRFEDLSRNVDIYSGADIRARYGAGDTINVAGVDFAKEVDGEGDFFDAVRTIVGRVPSIKIPRPIQGDFGWEALLGLRLVTKSGQKGANGKKDFPGVYKTIKIMG